LLLNVVLFGLLQFCAQLVLPLVAKRIVDFGIQAKNPTYINELCIALGVSAVVAFVGGLGHGYNSRLLSGRISQRLKSQAVGAMMHSTAIEPAGSGQLVSLFTSDIRMLAYAYGSFLRDMITSGFRFIGTLAALIWLYGPLGLLPLALIPAYWMLYRAVSPFVGRYSSELQLHQDNANRLIHEAICGVAEIKASQAERFWLGRMEGTFDQAHRTEMRLFVWRDVHTITYLVFWATVCLIYLLAGRQVLAGSMSLGTLIALISYTNFVQDGFNRLFSLISEWPTVVVAILRVNSLVKQPVEDLESGQPVAGVEGGVRLSFDNVRFGYGQGREALCGVSFSLQPGEKLAIVGANGTGKSTLLLLAAGFLYPKSGRICLNDQNISSISKSSLRQVVGLMPQNTIIFDGTLAENISMFKPYSRDGMLKASLMAGVHEFTGAFEAGYETRLGESGIQLSAGQKKRVGFARVLHRIPKVLLLDEATSSLDVVAERHLQRTIASLGGDLSCILVCHDAFSASLADRVLFLKHGRVWDEGQHEELMRRSAEYRRHFLPDGERTQAGELAKTAEGIL
jgi:ABC-type multidrug transport system fused ATPase/permease subunit